MKKILLFFVALIICTPNLLASTRYTVRINQHSENNINSNQLIGKTNIKTAYYELFDENDKLVSKISSTIRYSTDKPHKYHIIESGKSTGYIDNTPLDLMIETTEECPYVDIDITKFVKTYNLELVNNTDISSHVIIYDSSNNKIFNQNIDKEKIDITLIYDSYVIYIDNQKMEIDPTKELLHLNHNGIDLNITNIIQNKDSINKISYKCYDEEHNLIIKEYPDIVKDTINDMENINVKEDIPLINNSDSGEIINITESQNNFDEKTISSENTIKDEPTISIDNTIKNKPKVITKKKKVKENPLELEENESNLIITYGDKKIEAKETNEDKKISLASTIGIPCILLFSILIVMGRKIIKKWQKN